LSGNKTKSMKPFLTVLFLGTTFFCCKKPAVEKNHPTEPGEVTISLNNCVENNNTNRVFTVCFDKLVEDSRCPATAICVWQGVAVAKFTFTAGTAQHSLTLATAKYPGFPSTDTVVAGYSIKLLNITPYPGTSTTQEPTRAALQISR
jgi:hypothetical protein